MTSPLDPAGEDQPQVTLKGLRFITDPDCPPDTMYLMRDGEAAWVAEARERRTVAGIFRRLGRIAIYVGHRIVDAIDWLVKELLG